MTEDDRIHGNSELKDPEENDPTITRRLKGADATAGGRTQEDEIEEPAPGPGGVVQQVWRRIHEERRKPKRVEVNTRGQNNMDRSKAFLVLTLGTFFFDLPSPEERIAIWNIYMGKYGLSGELPDDDGWTGAEIKECCRMAYRLKLTLKKSAEYIVPVARSAADQIKTLRQQASGKFISASHPGVYEYQDSIAMARTGRAFRTPGD